MGTEHIPSPEVIKELQGGLKALSGKTVILLVSLNYRPTISRCGHMIY